MFKYLSKALEGLTFTNSLCSIGIYNIICAVLNQTPEYAAAGAISILLAVLVAFVKERF